MLQFTAKITQLWRSWKTLVAAIVTKLALLIVYFLGVGVTSLVGKLVGRQFLRRRFTHSSWQPITGSQKLQRMY